MYISNTESLDYLVRSKVWGSYGYLQTFINGQFCINNLMQLLSKNNRILKIGRKGIHYEID